MKTIKFWVCGGEYSLTFRKRYSAYGYFDTGKNILILREDAAFSTLLHELLELIMTELSHRYYSNDGSADHLFQFSHGQLHQIDDNLAGALQQIIKQLPKAKIKQWKLDRE